MESKMKKLIANITVNACKKSAESAANSACFMGLYQPKEPKCLKKKA